jgi:hypothetical protein
MGGLGRNDSPKEEGSTTVSNNVPDSTRILGLGDIITDELVVTSHGNTSDVTISAHDNSSTDPQEKQNESVQRTQTSDVSGVNDVFDIGQTQQSGGGGGEGRWEDDWRNTLGIAIGAVVVAGMAAVAVGMVYAARKRKNQHDSYNVRRGPEL